MSTIQPCPPDIRARVLALDCARLGMSLEEHGDIGWFGYIPDYCTDGPGWLGEVVVIIWPADPGACTIWGRRRTSQPDVSGWEHIRQTVW